MASWKKVIVSGSAAELSSLTLDTALAVADGGTGASTLTDKAVLISQDSGTDAINSLTLSTNGQIVVGGTNGPAAASITSNDGSTAKSGSLKVTGGDGTLDLSIQTQSLGIGNLSSSGTPTAGNVLKVSSDGNYFTFGSTSDGDLTEIITPANGGIEIGAGTGPIPSLTMSIKDLASNTDALALTDTIGFGDTSDTTSIVTTKKATLSQLIGGISGSISGSILDTIAGDVNVDVAGVSTIQADAVEGSMLNSNVAGLGIELGTDSTLSMSINDLNAGIVSPANDMIAFNDSNGNETKKQKLEDFMNIQAGGGIQTSSGQFAVHLFTADPGLELADEDGLSKLRLKSTIGGNKTFSGDLTVQGNTTLGNAATDKTTINGDLEVTGTASFTNSTNLSVADKYILLNSGSSAVGDGGIVIQQATNGKGELFGFDSSANRFGITGSFNSDTSADFAPDAFMSMVVSGSAGQNTPDVAPARYQQAGNIFAGANGDIYIYGS
jgi:hypothetical protein